MVDKTLILRKFAEIEEYLRQIKEFSGVSIEQYSRDWKIQRIVERTLQMMIETAVDIANHIISDKGYRIPKGYADTFRVLNEEGILEEDTFGAMESMAKFRNIVVHQYDKIDEAIVVGILKKHLQDFLTFRDSILKVLKNSH